MNGIECPRCGRGFMVPNTIDVLKCPDCGEKIDVEKGRRKMEVVLRIPDGELNAVGTVRDKDGNLKTDAAKVADDNQKPKREGG